jgi:hypothetical protein
MVCTETDVLSLDYPWRAVIYQSGSTEGVSVEITAEDGKHLDFIPGLQLLVF